MILFLNNLFFNLMQVYVGLILELRRFNCIIFRIILYFTGRFTQHRKMICDMLINKL